MKNSDPKPPAHLSREAKSWWRKLVAEYAISDEGGVLILQTAMEAFDAMRRAQSTISTEGETIKDRFDQTKSHPLHAVARDSRAQFLAALKALNLDIEQEETGKDGIPLGGEQLALVDLDKFRR